VDLSGSGRHHVIARTADGATVEEFDSDGEQASHSVYNIASATPLVEWTAVYGSRRDIAERKMGAPRWSTASADYVFEEPPKQISTKGEGGTRTVLQEFAGQGPSDQLELAIDEEEKTSLIAAHARWDAGDSRYIGQWLALASQTPEFNRLIGERLRRAPAEVAALRAEQDATKGKPEFAQVCARHRGLAERTPDSADLRYIAVRCAPDDEVQDRAFADGHARWPDHGWFALAAGYGASERAQWAQALPLLQQAAKMPQAAEWLGPELVRAQRAIEGESAQVTSLDSEQLKFLLAVEQNTVPRESPYWAYAALKGGYLDHALATKQSSAELDARLLNMVAASDGAPAETVARALAQTEQVKGDPAAAWVLAALAAREHNAAASRLREDAMAADPEDAPKIAAFFDAVRRSGVASTADAERALGKVAPRSRGIAYATAVVLLGRDCPSVWRDGAKRLLFAIERPYFA
jgi:hypothetical protein